MTLLVLSVGATVVLSLLGRTTTDVTISNQIEESSRAFSAAEAGIDEALGGIVTGAKTLSSGATYNVSRSSIGGAVGVFQFPTKVTRSGGETLWLVEHTAQGALVEAPTYTAPSIDVCWSQEATTPAMGVSVLYKEASDGSYRVARGMYDPDAARRATNGFSAVTAGSGGCGPGTDTTYKQTVTFASLSPSLDPTIDTLIMLRVSPFYSDATVAVSTTQALASQGVRIESSGTSGSGVTRKIVVYQQYNTPSSIFDYAVYSQGSFGH